MHKAPKLELLKEIHPIKWNVKEYLPEVSMSPSLNFKSNNTLKRKTDLIIDKWNNQGKIYKLRITSEGKGTKYK